MSDYQIYRLILAGNQEGLSLLLDKYGGLLKYIASNLGKLSDEDIEECISDTLLTIWKRIN
jgi:DNA-directed RNA polymerase specialized sigma24 family protein